MKEWRNVGKHGMSLINGASNVTDSERAEHDFYATDPKAMEALLCHERFAQRIWEPCCGAGHLSNVLKEHGYDVKESDIVDRIGNEVIDFLQSPPAFDGDIITNPPYSMAKECVENALGCIAEGHKVAMFLKLTFLEGKARRELFRQSPPLRIYVFSERQKCAPNGDFSAIKGSAVCYAWFVWHKGYNGEPSVRWI